LLDWTLDPFVAAYFAVEKPRGNCSCGRVGVWRFDREKLARTGKDVRTWVSRYITIPYDVNQNARAQRGVFTLHFEPLESLAEPPEEDRRSFDEYLRAAGAEEALTRVTLSASEAPQVLRLLNGRRINGATIFPGYYGATRAAKERESWDPSPK
jgi:hypothetical protein